VVSLSRYSRVWFVLLLVAASVVAAAGSSPGQSGRVSPACRVAGHVTSGRDPLPGASVVVHAGDTLKTATSTDIDGSFALSLAPGASYRLDVELTAFATGERAIAVGAPPCDTTVDVQLVLAARRERRAPAGAARPGRGFQTLTVQPEAAAEAAPGAPLGVPLDEAADAARLLPPGFAADGAGRRHRDSRRH
jgi:hypothetical protein